MATHKYEAKTLDRVKRRLFQQQQRGQGGLGGGRGLGASEERSRASSISTLYTGTRVNNIPEFSLRVVTRPSEGEC